MVRTFERVGGKGRRGQSCDIAKVVADKFEGLEVNKRGLFFGLEGVMIKVSTLRVLP